MLGTIVVMGGTGFVGRHVVNRLVGGGWEVDVPTRRFDNARRLWVLPTVDVFVANVHQERELARLLRGAAAVINLVGILNESDGETFRDSHVALASKVVAACRESGVRRLIHMSALHADPAGPSAYLRSKAEAARTIAESGLDWTIFEPSVIFGPEDRFLNLFAKLASVLPVLALPAADAKFQPVFAGDVAECIVRSVSLPASIGQRYRLCGPKTYTLRELVRFVGEVTGAPRPIIGLGPTLGALEALILELVPGSPMSRDNLASMKTDSVCGCPFPAIFDISPAALETIAPTYLAPEARQSRYAAYRGRGVR